MKLISLTIFFLTNLSVSFGQTNPAKDRLAVLKHNRIGRTYTFDRSKKEDYDRTEITYLGRLTTKAGRVYKILTSKWIWGSVPRATSRIVIYNNRDQYL